jgi:hypothetical protein
MTMKSVRQVCDQIGTNLDSGAPKRAELWEMAQALVPATRTLEMALQSSQIHVAVAADANSLQSTLDEGKTSLSSLLTNRYGLLPFQTRRQLREAHEKIEKTLTVLEATKGGKFVSLPLMHVGRGADRRSGEDRRLSEEWRAAGRERVDQRNAGERRRISRRASLAVS